ncbi:nucleotide pyrophosphohydrolase [Crenobacter cavernae]|uniref:Nucleotide pyrophosphohydrolase n=1 Tax=Crenobacter cavernae TaxID=2290923 RepID=A0ABY0FI86_9NEIS|nr:nucleotide pyrophosphohydrolase [Crenobacter cavernae]RXZ45326.1 nucleotide pyrophosphohydrolase [Crenobacter cavernae]
MDQATLADLLARCRAFRDARDWQRFHSAFNLIVSLNLEAAELLEFTQWQSEQGLAERLESDPDAKQALAHECADVMMYLLMLSDAAGIDLYRSVIDKLAINEARYPADKARGVSTKYRDL